MKYLVTGSEGPGFASPEEALRILEDIVLPGFDHPVKLEAEKRILAGGFPVGDRAFVFIAEASNNDELDQDQLWRRIPFWGAEVENYPTAVIRGMRGAGTRRGEGIQEIEILSPDGSPRATTVSAALG